MDFFSSKRLSAVSAPDDNADPATDAFAQAIAGRFHHSARGPLFTARLDPVATPGPAPTPLTAVPSPLSNMQLRSPPPRSTPSFPSAATSASSSRSIRDDALRFTLVTADSLPAVLDTPNLLVVDIRPHSAFSSARLPNAISLSVPSTLLKRPAFTLEKLATMLSNNEAQSRFSAWKDASRILVYDADTHILQDHSNLLGLLRKFVAEGFTGDVAWLQGGIQALWRHHRGLVEEGSASDEEDLQFNDQVLRARALPASAFQQSSTTSTQSPGKVRRDKTISANPTTRLMASNPFFDNIRQNSELSQGITERISLQLPESVMARIDDLPFAWLRDLVAKAGKEESTEALAMQFYRIELGEQRRMQGVMAHHSQPSQVAEKPKEEKRTFPFSILAGVEKGSKNRYRNIWPFEHARVRLKQNTNDDYVNASYVQPLGTRRSYIATQGPLPSTYADFWTLAWEQDVSAIVMLTREVEGAVAKCGNYWQSAKYGPLKVKLVSTTEKDGQNQSDQIPDNGFQFGVSNDSEASFEDMTIRRTFELSHSDQPHIPPRTLTQMQYLGWPDMNVPNNPDGLLKLIEAVDEIVEEGNARDGLPTNDESKVQQRPVLLHCSAGVGRTGGYILIDSILSGIKYEMRKRRKRMMAKRQRDSSPLVSRSDASVASSDSPNQMDTDASPVRQRTVTTGPPTTGGIEALNQSSLPAGQAQVFYPSSVQPLQPVAEIRIGRSKHGRSSSKRGVVEGKRESESASGTPESERSSSNKSDSAVVHVPVVPHEAGPTSPVPTMMSNDLGTSLGFFDTEATASLSRSQTKRLEMPHRPNSLPSEAFASTSPSFNLRSTHADKPSDMFVAALPPHSSHHYHQQQLAFLKDNPPIKPDFTVADADSMFTGPNLNPAFAMDVEPFSQEWATGRKAVESSDMESKLEGDQRPVGMTVASAGSPAPGAFIHARMRTLDDLWKASSDSDSNVTGSGSASANGGGSSSGSGGYSSSSSTGQRYLIPFPPTLSHMTSPATPHPSMLPFFRMHTSPTPRSGPPMGGFSDLHLSVTANPLTANTPSESPRHRSSRHQGSKRLPETSSATSLLISDTPSALSLHHHLESSATSASGQMTTSDMDTRSLSPLPSDSKQSSSRSKENEGRRSEKTSKTPEEMNSPSPPSDMMDYKPPRALHRNDSPDALSGMVEPFMEVLDDMREQRMSLCQSLRQYVFVHRAVIEGALRLVDEEQEFEANLAGVIDVSQDPGSRAPFMVERPTPIYATTGMSAEASLSSPESQSPSKNKRGPSPTELPKENKKGEIKLWKRPSVKRGKSTPSSGDSPPSSV